MSMGASNVTSGRPDLMMHDITSAIASFDDANSLIFNTTQSPIRYPVSTKSYQKTNDRDKRAA